MTFAEYLLRRRSYTEAAFDFRQVTATLPESIDSLDQALEWLHTTPVGEAYDNIMRDAWKSWLVYLRRKRRQAANGATR